MSFYQIGILGTARDGDRSLLIESLQAMIDPFGLSVGAGLDVLDSKNCLARDPKTAFAAIYFGGPGGDDDSLNAVKLLVRENIPIIPVVDDLATFSSHVPAALQAANGMALGNAGPKLEAPAAAILECVGLLRRQRGVFLSYRRGESANTALQLHDVLSHYGFDVFIDTSDVRPGEDFQAVLWHRLCDGDVLVMLDTKGYFSSRWTAAENGRALAKKIAVLGIVWPGHEPERPSLLRESIFLEPTDLLGDGGPLAANVVDRIRIDVERLRSRSLAIRHALPIKKPRDGACRAAASKTLSINEVVTGSRPGLQLKLVVRDFLAQPPENVWLRRLSGGATSLPQTLLL